MIFELAQDFHDAVAAMPREHVKHRVLELLEEAIRGDIHFIDCHPTTLFQCMWNTCWWYDCPEAAKHYVSSHRRKDAPRGWLGRALRRVSKSLAGDLPLPRAPMLSDLLKQWQQHRHAVRSSPCWIRSVRPPARRLGANEKAVLQNHEDSVQCVSWSPNGRWIASGSSDRTVRIWNADTYKEEVCLRGHTGPITCICHSPDGRMIASGSWSDNTIRIWDALTWDQICVLRGHENGVYSICFSHDGRRIASGSSDKTVRVWDTANGRNLQVFRGHEGWVCRVAYSFDGLRIAACDEVIRIWGTEAGDKIGTAERGNGTVLDLCYTSDGLRVLTRLSDNSVLVRNHETGEELSRIPALEDEVKRGAFSRDGRRFATIAYSRGAGRNISSTPKHQSYRYPCTVHVWDTETGKELARLCGHDDDVSGIAFSPDCRRVATAEGSVFTRRASNLRVWDAAARSDSVQLREHEIQAVDVRFSECGRCLASRGDFVEGLVLVWSPETGRATLRIGGQPGDCIWSMCFSPDGRHIAVGAWTRSHGHVVWVWNALTGQEVACLHGHHADITSLAFSPCGHLVAAGARWKDRAVRVWDVRKGLQTAMLERRHSGDVVDLCFSPDGQRIAAAIRGMLPSDRCVMVWDVASGQEVTCIDVDERELLCLCFSPDGRKVASGSSSDSCVCIHSAETGLVIERLRGDGGPVTKMAYSLDGHLIVTMAASERSHTESVLRVWDVQRSECVETIRGLADIEAVALGQSWRAIARGRETVISPATGGGPVAWFPRPLDHMAAHPCGRIWGGNIKEHVYIIGLEDMPDLRESP